VIKVILRCEDILCTEDHSLIEWSQVLNPDPNGEMTMPRTKKDPNAETETAPLPALDLSGAKMAVVGSDVLAARQRPRTGKAVVRSKEQLAIDKMVELAYKKWVEAGKPKEFSKSPGGHLTVPESQVLVVERAIRKSGVFLHLSIRFGSNEPDADGNVVIVFRAADPRPPKATPETEG
jgi:hypothetical protein